MKDLLSYAAALETSDGALPPVDQWNPTFCGDIDLVIKRDGTWFHEGTPIGRARLVRLFSTVLKREGDEYFLVTPVEKMRITVEDVPFIAVLMDVATNNSAQRLTFTTNVGDVVVADEDHPLIFRNDLETDQAAPYLHIRAGLEARVSRAVFYDLIALGETYTVADNNMFGVRSEGQFFSFGAAQDVFTET